MWIRSVFFVSVLLAASAQAQLDAASRLASLLASSVTSNLLSNAVNNGNQDAPTGPALISSSDIQRALLQVLRSASEAQSVTTESPDDMLANSIGEARSRFVQSLARLIRGDFGEAATMTDRLAHTLPLGRLAEEFGLAPEDSSEVSTAAPEEKSDEDLPEDPADSDLMVGLARSAGQPPTLVPFRSVLSQALLDSFGNSAEANQSSNESA